MAFGFAVLLFVVVASLVLVFGYRSYVRPGRVYDRLAVESGPAGAAGAPANPDFFTVIEFMERVGRAIPPAPAKASRFQALLIASGYRQQNAVAVFYGAKIALAGGLLALALLFQLGPGLPMTMRLFLVVGAIVAGYQLPDFLLKRRLKQRRNRLRMALPDALDLMVVCTEAGLALDRSFQAVTQQLAIVHPELTDEFSLVRAEITAGIRRQEALENLAARTQEPEIRKFVTVLVQADRFGTSMGDALRVHAEYLRVRRRQHAEERASKVGVKLIFPIFFFIMPCMLLVTAGPAAIQIATHLGPALGGH
ncbi:MAG: type II secretion system F family protein [Acidobacteriia bacterium]|nr:type II secretion system F family protein [Terriglobia bacterium]